MDRCIALHKEKPWIPNFRRVLVQPQREVDQAWLGEKVRFGAETWYVPTRAFWEVHCRASHDGGPGCDAAKHTAFLALNAPNPEFLYAHQFRDGSLRVLSSQDFDRECRWWADHFRGGGRKGGRTAGGAVVGAIAGGLLGALVGALVIAAR